MILDLSYHTIFISHTQILCKFLAFNPQYRNKNYETFMVVKYGEYTTVHYKTSTLYCTVHFFQVSVIHHPPLYSTLFYTHSSLQTIKVFPSYCYSLPHRLSCLHGLCNSTIVYLQGSTIITTLTPSQAEARINTFIYKWNYWISCILLPQTIQYISLVF